MVVTTPLEYQVSVISLSQLEVVGSDSGVSSGKSTTNSSVVVYTPDEYHVVTTVVKQEVVVGVLVSGVSSGMANVRNTGWPGVNECSATAHVSSTKAGINCIENTIVRDVLYACNAFIK